MEEKILKSSRGKCLCQSLEEMKECLQYKPWEGDYQPEMCAWLCKWSGIICLYSLEPPKLLDKATIERIKEHVSRLNNATYKRGLYE